MFLFSKGKKLRLSAKRNKPLRNMHFIYENNRLGHCAPPLIIFLYLPDTQSVSCDMNSVICERWDTHRSCTTKSVFSGDIWPVTGCRNTVLLWLWLNERTEERRTVRNNVRGETTWASPIIIRLRVVVMHSTGTRQESGWVSQQGAECGTGPWAKPGSRWRTQSAELGTKLTSSAGTLLILIRWMSAVTLNIP